MNLCQQPSNGNDGDGPGIGSHLDIHVETEIPRYKPPTNPPSQKVGRDGQLLVILSW